MASLSRVFERDILIGRSLRLRLPWGDQGAVKDGVAKLLEPREGGILDDRFGEGRGRS